MTMTARGQYVRVSKWVSAPVKLKVVGSVVPSGRVVTMCNEDNVVVRFGYDTSGIDERVGIGIEEGWSCRGLRWRQRPQSVDVPYPHHASAILHS